MRAYTPDASGRRPIRRRQHHPLPTHVLVFDTETRVDAQQALTFGCYRYYINGYCVEEGLFHGDDLNADELACLQEYSRTATAGTTSPHSATLHLRSRSEFLKLFYDAAYKARSMIVGFNLPFDLSRLAFDVSEARDSFAGGFSLALWDWRRPDGTTAENKYRPRMTIKHIDSKRALKSFTRAAATDNVDRIPEDSRTGKPDKGYVFRGHFLDLKTLAFALTDRGHSLKSACEAFGVEHGKVEAHEHGRVTPQYIDYNRRDVLATAELYFKLMEEYERHPISLQATKAYSPASIGKAYLRAMGVRPVLERQPDFSKVILGNTMSAFYGGRTGAHIRRTIVPCVYCDFLSMYPTVNALMGLWRFVVASSIDVVDATTEVQRFLSRVTMDTLFQQKTWKRLPAFVQLEPNDDILPMRAQFDETAGTWQVGINNLSVDPTGTHEALWYSLPDVVASVLLTGRVPKISRAIQLKAKGRQRGLKPIKLRGDVLVDPRTQDFFKTVIEERKRIGQRDDLPGHERQRLDKSLKVLANATSYGILAEMTVHELGSGKKEAVTVYGLDEEPFTYKVSAPETPGEYCFPPLAALITGAARLQLALLERCVTDLGGTYAMEDTDSMAIVATKAGALVACPGGSYHTQDGADAICALSWAQVRNIVSRFEALNPYDRAAIPGSILKVEDDNFDPTTGAQREIYCFAISAKRYALFVYNDRGQPELLQKGVNNKTDGWSEHGLGHLLNPTNPDDVDRDWIRQVWLRIIRDAVGLTPSDLPWIDRPAIGRVSVSSPAVLRLFSGLNAEKIYARRIKPYNFLLSAHLAPEGHPIGVDPQRFHLVAPYEADARKWDRMEWIDQYSGAPWRATTLVARGTRNAARLTTYGEIIEAYAVHQESKSAGSNGEPSSKGYRGLLRRRHVIIESMHHIGKESNRLEDAQAGMVHDLEEVCTEYVPSRQEQQRRAALTALRSMTNWELQQRTGLARSTIQRLRNQGARPRKRTADALCYIPLDTGAREKACPNKRVPSRNTEIGGHTAAVRGTNARNG